jgi:hypothetical protein
MPRQETDPRRLCCLKTALLFEDDGAVFASCEPERTHMHTPLNLDQTAASSAPTEKLLRAARLSRLSNAPERPQNTASYNVQRTLACWRSDVVCTNKRRHASTSRTRLVQSGAADTRRVYKEPASAANACIHVAHPPCALRCRRHAQSVHRTGIGRQRMHPRRVPALRNEVPQTRAGCI